MFDRFTYLSGSDSLFVSCPSLHQTKAFKHSLLLQYRAHRASSLICGYYCFTSFKSLLDTHASNEYFSPSILNFVSQVLPRVQMFLMIFFEYLPLGMLYPNLTFSSLLRVQMFLMIFIEYACKNVISSSD